MPRHLFQLLIVLLLTGCGTFQIPPPANTAARIGSVPHDIRTMECRIFVVTDRDAQEDRQPHIFFKNKPSYNVKAASGIVQIDQASKTVDQLWANSVSEQGISPKLLDLDPIGTLWSTVPMRYATTNPAESADAAQFCKQIDDCLIAMQTDEIVVFVHGYNTQVEDNAAILASLWHYSGRNFVPIAFEWPSDVQLLSYTIDKQNAARSTRALRMTLELLAQKTRARRINIIAHSAGTAVAINAIHQLRLRSSDLSSSMVQSKYRIGSVVLAAPDVDTVEYLNAVMDGLLDVPERLTIYMSSKDLALKLSRWLFGDNRLGFISSARVYSGESKWLAKLVNGYAIDVAPALNRYPADWLGHSYYYRNPIVSQDVIRTLTGTEEPRDRGLNIDPTMPGIWALPEMPPELK